MLLKYITNLNICSSLDSLSKRNPEFEELLNRAEPATITPGKYRTRNNEHLRNLHNSKFLVRNSIFVFKFARPLDPSTPRTLY
jgi:hypothetical protein